MLDLGCGTGLELEEYFKICPTAAVTAMDLSAGMLGAMAAKFPDKNITAVRG
ncbi:MAG: class I SAM-dependent methyltransferase [Ruminococcus sp.]|nr:class I SAM-dependent methyltransferase [Ruminococcus sp.]